MVISKWCLTTCRMPVDRRTSMVICKRRPVVISCRTSMLICERSLISSYNRILCVYRSSIVRCCLCISNIRFLLVSNVRFLCISDIRFLFISDYRFLCVCDVRCLCISDKRILSANLLVSDYRFLSTLMFGSCAFAGCLASLMFGSCAD